MFLAFFDVLELHSTLCIQETLMIALNHNRIPKRASLSGVFGVGYS